MVAPDLRASQEGTLAGGSSFVVVAPQETTFSIYHLTVINLSFETR